MAGEPLSEDDLLAYVHGTPAPGVSERIEARMARDPAFKAEVALMRGLKPALGGGDGAFPVGEFGWRRLEAAIGLEAAQARPRPAMRQTAMLRLAAALFGVAALGQAVYIGAVLSPGGAPAYRTSSAATESFVLGVAFAPGATAAEIGALLRDAGARVIDGPSAIGLFRLAFASEDARRAAAARFRASDAFDLVADE